MTIMKIEQYEATKNLLQLLQQFPSMGQSLFEAAYDAEAEFVEVEGGDWEVCEGCGHIRNECGCDRDYGGREYDDGDSFE